MPKDEQNKPTEVLQAPKSVAENRENAVAELLSTYIPGKGGKISYNDLYSKLRQAGFFNNVIRLNIDQMEENGQIRVVRDVGSRPQFVMRS